MSIGQVFQWLFWELTFGQAGLVVILFLGTVLLCFYAVLYARWIREALREKGE